MFKLDRAFRSVKHMHDTLTAWEMSGVSFQSVKDQFDTSTAIGRLLINLLAALAEFELELIHGQGREGWQPERKGHRVVLAVQEISRRGWLVVTISKSAPCPVCGESLALRPARGRKLGLERGVEPVPIS